MEVEVEVEVPKIFFCDLHTDIDQGQSGVGHPASHIAEPDPQSWLNFKDFPGGGPISGRITRFAYF